MELSSISISELVNKIKNKDYKTFDVINSYLKSIELLNPKLNCYVHIDKEKVLKRAEEIDETVNKGIDPGPLTGIPIAVKNNMVIENSETTCCSNILKSFISPYNSTCVQKLYDAGAVIIGTTNMDEFAMGSSNESSCNGVVHNPWNINHVPGGSSGGSAAATASRLCCGAIGSDTGGSIRQPAAFCGVTGLKPTYGRVSRYGLIAYASSLDQIGPFASNTNDLATILNVISGYDSKDSTSVNYEVPDYTQFCVSSPNKMKIGIVDEYFNNKGNTKEVLTALNEAIKVFSKHDIEIVNVSLPHADYAIPVYYLLATAEASSNLARFDGIKYGLRAKNSNLNELYVNSRSKGFGAEVKRRIMLGTFALSSGYYDAYYSKAQKVRTLIIKDFQNAFKECDALLMPTAPSSAWKIGEKTDDPLKMYLEDIYTISCNLAGLPGISQPCGFSENGLPIGMQLISPHFKEDTLFTLASSYERSTNWHLQKPKICK